MLSISNKIPFFILHSFFYHLHSESLNQLIVTAIMKKFIQIITSVIFLTGFATHAQTIVKAEKANANQSIILAKDAVLEVRLPSTPSTGFGWYLRNEEKGIVTRVGEEEFISDDIEHPIGNSGIQLLKYIGVSSGSQVMEFVYKRPWEDDSDIADTYTFTAVSEGAYSGPPVETKKNEIVPLDNDSYVVRALPANFSWQALGKCTPCKNQAKCGSCWTFAACGSFESVIKIVDNVETDLAEQWLVNCDKRYYGCSGGMCPNDMFKSGAVYEVDQPYKAANGTCKSSYPRHEKIKDTYSAGSTVASIKQAIYDYGPVWAAVYVGDKFKAYQPGTVFSQSEAGTINHAIVLVGWEDSTKSWVLRNSWGTSWGEHEGYMRIRYGTSSVGSNAAYINYKGKIDHNTTSIDDVAQHTSVQVFPNPSNGIVTLEGLKQQDGIEIYNVIGKLIYKTTATTSSASINLTEASRGIYFYRITDPVTHAVAQGKLILQ